MLDADMHPGRKFVDILAGDRFEQSFQEERIDVGTDVLVVTWHQTAIAVAPKRVQIQRPLFLKKA